MKNLKNILSILLFGYLLLNITDSFNFSNYVAPNHVFSALDVQKINGNSLFSSLVFSSYVATKSNKRKLDLLSKDSIEFYLNQFWIDVLSKPSLPKKTKLAIQLRIRFIDNSKVSYSQIFIVSINDKKWLTDRFVNRIALKEDNYEAKEALDVIFFYSIILSDSENRYPLNYGNETLNPTIESISINNFTLGNKTLPLTTDLVRWGQIKKQEKNKLIIKKLNSPFSYVIYTYVQNISYNLVKVWDSARKTVLEFKDLLGANVNSFTRVIGNTKFIIENSRIVLKEITKKFQYMQVSVKHDRKFEKFITLDIETRTINGVFIPYCISLYDGKKAWSFYLTDYKDSNDMLKAAINSILRNKYNHYMVYAHNFSGFDGIFLLKILADLGHIEPLMRDGKIININLRFAINNNKQGLLKFRDSLLLLPNSLRDLADSLKVESKSFFPFDFVNDPNVDLNYVGPIPEYSLWKDITKYEFEQLQQENWSLKNETIKYCQQDCITLHQILVEFNNLVYDRWSLNISKFPTISSLALGIYKSNYMKENTVPKITGQMAIDIRKAFTGGRTDTFVPYTEKQHHYDVNSLYPHVMATQPMPVGPVHYFEGNMLNHKPEAFGFFYCKVTTPENMNIPLLQTKVDTGEGLRTIAPLGTWYDWIFSEEIKKLSEHGYQFEVLKGYTFGKEIIFKEYVDDLYKIKQESQSGSPMYRISKLLLNSLFGKMGVNLDSNEISVVSSKDLHLTFSDSNVWDVIDLNNGKSIVFFSKKDLDLTEETYNGPDANVAIAAAISSLGRIHMLPFLTNPNYGLVYIDTDGVILSAQLKTSPLLGNIKYEGFYDKLWCLAPKFYGGILSSGYSFVKAKGYKGKIDISVLDSLRTKGSVVYVSHDKWYKNLEEGTLHLKTQTFSLRASILKRKPVYDDNNLLIYTTPFVINRKKEIINY